MTRRLLLLTAFPLMVCAQMPRGVWWEGKIAQDLNLTDTQSQQIKTIVKEFRGRTMELRTAVNKAESELEAVFNQDPVDQKKANDAIERLAAARADMFRSTSQMELKFRSVLTADQWQELKKRVPMMRGPDGRPGGPPPGPWRRGPGGPSQGKGTTATGNQ